MPLQMIVESLDKVPEPLREEYEEADGKYRLKIEGVEDVSGLKSALQKERDAARQASKRLKMWENIARTPEEIQELIRAAEDAETDATKKAGNIDAVIKQHQSRWEAERNALVARAEAAERSERGAVVSTRLMGALSRLGATDEGLDLLPERLATRISYEMDGDQRVIKITDKDGQPMTGGGEGGMATFDDLANEAATRWPSLFAGSGKSGSGTRSTSGGGGSATLKRSTMSAKDKADYIVKHGQSEYLKIPK